MKYLYENQDFDFVHVCGAIGRFFGPGHSVTIHDGDDCDLFSRVPGSYCAGTVVGKGGERVATFAIDYITEKKGDGQVGRHVIGVLVGPIGHWCRSQSELDPYNDWLDQLAREFGDVRVRPD